MTRHIVTVELTLMNFAQMSPSYAQGRYDFIRVAIALTALLTTVDESPQYWFAQERNA